MCYVEAHENDRTPAPDESSPLLYTKSHIFNLPLVYC